MGVISAMTIAKVGAVVDLLICSREESRRACISTAVASMRTRLGVFQAIQDSTSAFVEHVG